VNEYFAYRSLQNCPALTSPGIHAGVSAQENPYLQFFLGREEFSQERPFDASLMVAQHKDYGRKRFGEDGIQRMAETIALASLQKQEKETEPKTETESKPQSGDDSDPPANQGKLITDATCAPAALCY